MSEEKEGNSDSIVETTTTSASKEAMKKKKKEKKRKRKSEDKAVPTLDLDANSSMNKKKDGDDDDNNKKDMRREERKKERAARRQAKEDLLEKVPKTDEDGIAYTKLQIKRMVKRVKQGLPPVPTEKEKQERLRNEAQLRREEEAELAGMIFNRNAGGAEEEEVEDSEGEDKDAEKMNELGNSGEEEDQENEEKGTQEEDGEKATESKTEQDSEIPPKKKTKRAKAVPADYICQACKNRHTPAHWIYDCPDKKTMKGVNNKKKKDRGFHEPDSRKLFISGLPFEVKPADIEQVFQGCGKLVSCKLLKFNDTGRCNGQAYVSFDSDEAATKALKLSGTMINNNSEDKKKQKKKSKDLSANKRQELKLKISRVLNRRMTKKAVSSK